MQKETSNKDYTNFFPRQLMVTTKYPSSLEQLLFLFFNNELQENPNIIDKAIAWEKDEKLKAATAASAAAAAIAATAAAAVVAITQEDDENQSYGTPWLWRRWNVARDYY